MTTKSNMDPFITRGFSPGFILAVQAGRIPGAFIESKFAENPSIASAFPAHIWDFPDADEFTFPATAAIDSISSANAADEQEIVLQGLDGNWGSLTQCIPLEGQSRVQIVPLIRIHRMFNGNGTETLGNIYCYENGPITNGVPNDPLTVRACVTPAEQGTLMGVFTVPGGFTGFFLGFSASLSKKSSGGTATVTGKARGFGGVFITQIRFAISANGTSYVTVPSNASSSFPERTDFFAMADVSNNDTGISVTFDLLLLNNEIFNLPTLTDLAAAKDTIRAETAALLAAL